jgi:hypothetical protein
VTASIRKGPGKAKERSAQAAASSDIRITGPRYLDAGQTMVCTFTVVGTHDGPLGPFPATGGWFALPLCELWHFDPSGRVVGGDLYYWSERGEMGQERRYSWTAHRLPSGSSKNR